MVTDSAQREINALRAVLKNCLKTDISDVEKNMIDFHLRLIAKAAINDFRKKVGWVANDMEQEINQMDQTLVNG